MVHAIKRADIQLRKAIAEGKHIVGQVSSAKPDRRHLLRNTGSNGCVKGICVAAVADKIHHIGVAGFYVRHLEHIPVASCVFRNDINAFIISEIIGEFVPLASDIQTPLLIGSIQILGVHIVYIVGIFIGVAAADPQSIITLNENDIFVRAYHQQKLFRSTGPLHPIVGVAAGFLDSCNFLGKGIRGVLNVGKIRLEKGICIALIGKVPPLHRVAALRCGKQRCYGLVRSHSIKGISRLFLCCAGQCFFKSKIQV